MEMKNKVYNGENDKVAERDIENRTNQDNGNSNKACKCLKFVTFASTRDQVI